MTPVDRFAICIVNSSATGSNLCIDSAADNIQADRIATARGAAASFARGIGISITDRISDGITAASGAPPSRGGDGVTRAHC